MRRSDRRPSVAVALVLVLAGATACDPTAPPNATGRIDGIVRYSGDAPERRRLDMSSAPICASLHDGPAFEERLVLGEAGGVADAFVHVVAAPAGATGDGTATAGGSVVDGDRKVLEQRNCLYHPRVLGVEVGEPLLVRNLDPTYHNLVAEAERNPELDISQPFEGMEELVRFETPEVMIPVRSAVHPWMRAWIGVVDHPYFAVTGADGTFSLEGLSPGTYTLEAWHEALGRRSVEITVEAGAVSEARIRF